VKYWGRVGRYTRLSHEEFDSPRQMDDRIFDIIKIRLSDGYRITALEGPAQRYEVLDRIVNLARAEHAIAEDIWVN
jgi:hypothetical protein